MKIQTKKREKKIDRHVGARVRARREEKGMSQQALAKKLGITYQQLQKGETGTNRFGASRMFSLAQLLEVPITYFFADLGEVKGASNVVRLGRGKSKRKIPQGPVAPMKAIKRA